MQSSLDVLGRHRVFVTLLLVIQFLTTAVVAADRSSLDIVTETGTHRYYVELALTPQQRSVGLMHRESMGQDAGMLFRFDWPQQASMWMRNTLIRSIWCSSERMEPSPTCTAMPFLIPKKSSSRANRYFTFSNSTPALLTRSGSNPEIESCIRLSRESRRQFAGRSSHTLPTFLNQAPLRFENAGNIIQGVPTLDY